MPLSPSRQRWILIGLLLIFGALFVMRGPVRAVDNGGDLMHLYAASVLWLEGGNPYDGAQCVQAMEHRGHHNPEHVAAGSFYPPPTIAALSPLGLMSWDAARLVWLVINMGCCALLTWVLACWLKIETVTTRWLLALLIVVAWGPVMTTLSLGQLAVAAAACVFAGLILSERGKAWPAGILIALGCLIKPQLGLGFLLLLALRREWLATAVAVVLLTVVTGVGIGRVMLAVPDWAGQMASNIAQDQAPGQVLDASATGTLRYQMSDLRPLLHLILPGAWVNLSALLLVALFAAAALWKLLRIGLERHALLAMSGVGLLVLLPVYHRWYDAVLLLPLIALVINRLMHDRRDGLILVIALALLPLFFPLPALFATLHQKGVIPDALYATWPWQNLVMLHQSWCVLIATIALVLWTWRLNPLDDGGLFTPPQAKDGLSS